MASECLEKFRHSVRIKAGRGQHPDADAIRFVFVGASEIDLLLGRDTLCPGHCAGDDVAVTADRAEQNGAEHRRHGQYAGALIGEDRARYVPLGDMRDFVGHHAGQFTFVFRGQQQA